MQNYVTSVKYIDTISPLSLSGITKVGYLGDSVLVVKYRHSVFVLALNDCAHGHFTRFNEAHLMNDEYTELTYWASVGNLTSLVFGESPFKHLTSNRGRLQAWPMPIFENPSGYRNPVVWEELTTNETLINHIVKFSGAHLHSYQETYEPQKLKPRNPPR